MSHGNNNVVPSGRALTNADINLVKELGRIGAVKWNEKPFRLKSGIESHVYVFGRNDLTENPDVLRKVGYRITKSVALLQEQFSENKMPILIGIPTAGSPIATAGSLASAGSAPIGARTMREKLKAHGAHHKWVDGDVREDHFYISVDNVVTDGESKFEALERLKQDGYPVDDMGHIIFIDRQQGGVERMKAAGITKLEVVFNLLDITFLFKKFGLWPGDAIDLVEREIKESRSKLVTV